MLTTSKKILPVSALLLALHVAASMPASAQLITSPISFTGGNGNLVYDENQTNGSTDTVNAPVIGLGDYAYAANLTSDTGGLPSGLLVTTAEGNSYQLGALSANSGARLDLGSVELTLNTPAIYSNVGFLVSGANGGGTVEYTLNFADGNSLTGSFNVPDWYSSSTPTSGNNSEGFTVVGTGSASTPGKPLDINGQFANSLYMYDFTTGNISNTSALQSIDLTEAGGGQIGVFALSGEVVPEPSTYALFILGGASLLFFKFRMRRRNA